ncbi:MAG: type II secretion system F family protein [Candidatus Micrarchaeota archaeon]
MMKIPFSILPPPLVLALSKLLLQPGAVLAKVSPSLRIELMQADVKMPPREYAAISLLVALSNMIIIGLIFAIFITAAKVQDAWLPAGGAILVVGAASFASVFLYPRVIATKRVRALEENLIPALRQMLIELRSGVTLFQAMGSVSEGYGETSREFKHIVEHMNVGVSAPDSIAEATQRNPSFKFRRVLWQISNALSVGSDISSGIEDMLVDLTKEKTDQIKRYGQELNPWTMMYMMGTVVLPSLGISTLVIVLSFLNVRIPKLVFPAMIVGLVLFQLFFIQFISTRRPVVE